MVAKWWNFFFLRYTCIFCQARIYLFYLWINFFFWQSFGSLFMYFKSFGILSAIRNVLVCNCKDPSLSSWQGSLMLLIKSLIRFMKIVKYPLKSLKDFHHSQLTLYHILLIFRLKKKSLNSLKI